MGASARGTASTGCSATISTWVAFFSLSRVLLRDRFQKERTSLEFRAASMARIDRLARKSVAEESA